MVTENPTGMRDISGAPLIVGASKTNKAGTQDAQIQSGALLGE